MRTRYKDFEQVNGATANQLMDELEHAEEIMKADQSRLNEQERIIDDQVSRIASLEAAVESAVQLLEQSAAPFDSACVALRKAINKEG